MTRTRLDQERISEAMRAAVTEVFATMLGSETHAGTAGQPGGTVDSAEYGLVSLMGLTGEWTGSAGLCCSANCACWIASQMLFSEYTEANDEVRDAVGEITNMIVGNFKNSITSETGPLAMSTPTVVLGREMKTSSSGAHEWQVFPFSSGDYSFKIMVHLHPAGNPVAERGNLNRSQETALAG